MNEDIVDKIENIFDILGMVPVKCLVLNINHTYSTFYSPQTIDTCFITARTAIVEDHVLLITMDGAILFTAQRYPS